MADIRFCYEQIDNAVTQINGFADEYQTTANNFINKLDSALSPWSGASKDKFNTLLKGDVLKYTSTTIPELVRALATLLQENAARMQEADEAVEKAIPSQLFE